MSWRAGIHGYAAKWGVVTHPLSGGGPLAGRPARFDRNCFTFDAAVTPIWFMHRGGQSYGMGRDLGLDLWADAYGLAFAFTPSPTAHSLVGGIADGRYCECSVGFAPTSTTAIPHGQDYLNAVHSATLVEVSICPRGACPGAVCWHAAHDPRTLRRDIAPIAAGWALGRARRPALRA